jgi:hypothetical protein
MATLPDSFLKVPSTFILITGASGGHPPGLASLSSQQYALHLLQEHFLLTTSIHRRILLSDLE